MDADDLALAKLLFTLENLVKSGRTTEAAVLLKQLYQDYAEDIVNMAYILTPVLRKIGDDAGTVLAAFVGSVNALGENTVLQGEIDRLMTIRAKTRKRALTAYTDVGFTKEEAMTLLLADVAKSKPLSQVAAEAAMKPRPQKMRG